MRRLLLLVALAGCTDTNLLSPGDGSDGQIVFASNRHGGTFQIYRIAARGGTPERLTNDPASNDFAPVPSRDGTRIAWEREVATTSGVAAKEIWVMNADGSDAHVVVRNGAFNESPSWGPGDASLVYASDVSGNWEVYAIPLAGGDPVNLTNSPFADRRPRVSPDGQRIAFHTNRDLDFEIYVMSLDGSGAANLSRNPEDDRFPAWTPDGSRILWSRYLDSFDIWEMDARGDNQRVVLASPFADVSPSVSPDGRLVVFQSDRGPPMSLFVAPIAGGGELRQLTGAPGAPEGSDQDPSWGR